jgi:hypothetical protein
MQKWRMLVRLRDRSLLDVAMDEIKRLHISLRDQHERFLGSLYHEPIVYLSVCVVADLGVL